MNDYPIQIDIQPRFMQACVVMFNRFNKEKKPRDFVTDIGRYIIILRENEDLMVFEHPFGIDYFQQII